MTHLYACAPGVDIARSTAAWLLANHAAEELPRAVVFVPTRRAAVALRRGFEQAAAGNALLLPRIVPLTGVGEALPALLGRDAFALLKKIPPAMSDYEQRYLLTRQVAAFEARRNPNGAMRLDQSLALAEELMALQDECARHEAPLTPEKLGALVHGNFAQHWEAALQFLRILADHWPDLEAALCKTTAATRETLLLRALATHWRSTPPDYPVYAVGSTASQPATAALLGTIAQLPRGAVVLPGLDINTSQAEWHAIAAGHPLHHVKQFMQQLNAGLCAVTNLPLQGEESRERSIWQEALLPSPMLPQWRERDLPAYNHIRLLPCAHGEEEARAIALLMREGLEQPGRTALITPDESLMARVAAHLKCFGVVADRLRAGTLAQTQTGSLWLQLVRCIAEPERLLHIRTVLHHSLSNIPRDYLAQLEPALHRRTPRRPGQLPPLSETLQIHAESARVGRIVAVTAKLAGKNFSASEWVVQLQTLLSAFTESSGEGSELVTDALEAIATAPLPPMQIREFEALLSERLSAPWRDASARANKRLLMLTPVEARLEHFERVIFGAMSERVWPGIAQTGAWLNLAARTALGLPSPQEDISLMAHDVLMHGNAREVFLSWPQREEGAPTTRSRFIERLVTLLATHRIAEETITAQHVLAWTHAQFAASHFAPATASMPKPARAMRPARISVSALDRLFSNPYQIYAESVLGLRKQDALDAEPDPRDFGTITHAAIHALTEHWNQHHALAGEAELSAMATQALRLYGDDPIFDVFWRTRLLRALQFVNEQEALRRRPDEQVAGEKKIEALLALPGGERITLAGKIDRIGQGAVADYKTGIIAKESEILGGKALQLLAYAMLCDAHGQKPEAIEYWQFPHGRREGVVQRTDWAALEAEQLPQRLRDALATLLREETPFLANPNGDARDDDYAGVSRYDEWAG